MTNFKLDINGELVKLCRSNFPNVRYRLIRSIGEWDTLYAHKTDYFTVDGKKLGFIIVRLYNRKGLRIYNIKPRTYIYTGE